MALYRFLFAPVLLAVAVVAGSGAREGSARPASAVHVQAVLPAPMAAPGFEKASATNPAARPVSRVERARVHPVR